MSFNRYTRLFPRLVSLELPGPLLRGPLLPGQLLLNPLLLSFLFLSFLLLTLFSQSLLAQPARQPVEGNPVRTPFTTELQPEWLLQVLPGAESFSEKEGEPPVYRGYRQTLTTANRSWWVMCFSVLMCRRKSAVTAHRWIC
jgi:hypothetical protein